MHFQIVNIDSTAISDANRWRSDPETTAATFAALASDRKVDIIHPGDILEITVFEVGMTLFGSGSISIGSIVDTNDASGLANRPQKLNGVVVAADGTITMPYIGRLRVAGSTVYDVQRMIEQGLKGKSQSPQVLVSVLESLSNSAYVFGDVTRPGRIAITPAPQRLLDAIATSGGGREPGADTVIRFSRDGQSREMRLGDIFPGSSADLRLLPGDRIELLSSPRTFSVFGASSRVSQLKFDAPTVSLAEAIARVGGPNDAQADPSAIYLFRYDETALAAGKPPVLYRLNMMRAESYLLAQRFMIRDKDVIYMANSAANPVTKFVSILNQLFSPVITASILSRSNN